MDNCCFFKGKKEAAVDETKVPETEPEDELWAELEIVRQRQSEARTEAAPLPTMKPLFDLTADGKLPGLPYSHSLPLFFVNLIYGGVKKEICVPNVCYKNLHGIISRCVFFSYRNSKSCLQSTENIWLFIIQAWSGGCGTQNIMW